jgi:tetratricopeptide (TPR) repeat protein
MSYKESGNMDKALAAFDRAIALDPDGFPWNHLNRSDLLLKKGDYERARVAAEKGLALLPEDALGLILKGRACIGLGLLEEARNLLQAARAKGPDGRLIEEAFQELENAGEAAP